MKKIILLVAGLLPLIMSSCGDMLDVDDKRAVEMPELNQKTDSLFYAAGIMQAMQQAADAYVLQNEMRGDLVTTTVYSDNNLRELMSHSRTETVYDSAYVYYRVINNCNYYLAHRDTSLYDGSYNVTRNEYAAVLTFRAWAYLQLARTYGKVKFITTPITSLSQIESDKSPLLDINGIVGELEDELKRFSGIDVTNPYGDIAYENGGNTVYLKKCCIPVNVILGEMYLEAGRYEDAAKAYYTYLFNTKSCATDLRSTFSLPLSMSDFIVPDGLDLRSINQISATNSWYDRVFEELYSDLICIIPMAATKLNGVTTNIPKLFGYDYYAVDKESYSDHFIDEVQIVPSKAYKLLADTSYYYYRHATRGELFYSIKVGDMRARAREGYKRNDDNTMTTVPMTYVDNTSWGPRIYLYHTTTIWLHLAEALNRMGYPDAAFAVLKDGITDALLGSTKAYYITEETRRLLTTTLPFCSYDGLSEQSQVFSGTQSKNYGIHRHGCSDRYGLDDETSLYQFDTVVGMKLREIENALNVKSAGTKADTINAVEDLLCDEYAMEFAFEGTRYSDLQRMARAKNNDTFGKPYGDNFGGRWLMKKLEANNPVEDLLNEANWYRPNPFTK